MSDQIKFYRGLESNLPPKNQIEVGALYHCVDTNNTYLGVQDPLMLIGTNKTASTAYLTSLGFKAAAVAKQLTPGTVYKVSNSYYYAHTKSDYEVCTTTYATKANALAGTISANTLYYFTTDKSVYKSTDLLPSYELYSSATGKRQVGGGIVIDNGEAKGAYSIAGGTNSNTLLTAITGKDFDIDINSSKANDYLSIAYGSGNIAHTVATNSIGLQNQAGYKGYYIMAYVGSKQIRISSNPTTQVDPTITTLNNSWNGCTLIVNNGESVYVCGTVTEVSGNIVTVNENLPFTTVTAYNGIPHDHMVIAIPPVQTYTDIVQGIINQETFRPECVGEVPFGWLSTTFGFDNIVAGTVSGAFGIRNTVTGLTAFATGRNNIVSNFAGFSSGFENKVYSNSGISSGQYNTVDGPMAGAFGYQNTVTGTGGFALGHINKVSGTDSMALGINNEITKNYGFAANNNTKVQANCASAFGHGTITSEQTDDYPGRGYAQMVIGKYNIYDDECSNNALFIIGNGSNDANRYNAFLVDKNNNAYVTGTLYAGDVSTSNASIDNLTIKKLNAGGGSSINSSTVGVAIGGLARTTSGNNNMAVGYGTCSTSESQTVVGRWNTVIEDTGTEAALFIVGNGNGNNDNVDDTSSRSNALVIRRNGNAEFFGDIYTDDHTVRAKQFNLLNALTLTGTTKPKFKIGNYAETLLFTDKNNKTLLNLGNLIDETSNLSENILTLGAYSGGLRLDTVKGSLNENTGKYSTGMSLTLGGRDASDTDPFGMASLSIGAYAKASGANSTALGYGTKTNTNSQVAVGKWNNLNSAFFIVGNGSNASNRSNALEVYSSYTNIYNALQLSKNDHHLTLDADDSGNVFSLSAPNLHIGSDNTIKISTSTLQLDAWMSFYIHSDFDLNIRSCIDTNLNSDNDINLNASNAISCVSNHASILAQNSLTLQGDKSVRITSAFDISINAANSILLNTYDIAIDTPYISFNSSPVTINGNEVYFTGTTYATESTTIALNAELMLELTSSDTALLEGSAVTIHSTGDRVTITSGGYINARAEAAINLTANDGININSPITSSAIIAKNYLNLYNPNDSTYGENSISTFNNITVGNSNTVTGSNSIVCGLLNTHKAQMGITIGYSNTNNQTNRGYVIGQSLTLPHFNANPRFVFGKYNDFNAIDENTLLVIGNGTYNAPSNALMIDYQGNLTVANNITAKHITTESISSGADVRIDANDMLRLGGACSGIRISCGASIDIDAADELLLSGMNNIVIGGEWPDGTSSKTTLKGIYCLTDKNYGDADLETLPGIPGQIYFKKA